MSNAVTDAIVMSTSTLLQLPAEVQHNIYSFVDPEDLGSMVLVCKTMHDYISKDSILHKDILIHHLVCETQNDGRNPSFSN